MRPPLRTYHNLSCGQAFNNFNASIALDSEANIHALLNCPIFNNNKAPPLKCTNGLRGEPEDIFFFSRITVQRTKSPGEKSPAEPSIEMRVPVS
jgi:hypothetical protein